MSSLLQSFVLIRLVQAGHVMYCGFEKNSCAVYGRLDCNLCYERTGGIVGLG